MVLRLRGCTKIQRNGRTRGLRRKGISGRIKQQHRTPTRAFFFAADSFAKNVFKMGFLTEEQHFSSQQKQVLYEETYQLFAKRKEKKL
jgi:hypothetical protein